MESKLKARTPWHTKFERPAEPRIVELSGKAANKWGCGKMLIATPRLVDGEMRKIERGKLATITQIRERLAKDFKVASTCQLTTGIFIRIAAEAAEEDRSGGKEDVTPYWRVIREDGSLIGKFPGGVEAQAERLREEGHTIEPGKGKKLPRVKDFDRSLAQL